MGYINGVLKGARRAAEAFNEDLKLSLSTAQLEADELYACGRTHQKSVDHAVLLILAPAQPQRCNGAAWRGALEVIAQHAAASPQLSGIIPATLSWPSPLWDGRKDLAFERKYLSSEDEDGGEAQPSVVSSGSYRTL